MCAATLWPRGASFFFTHRVLFFWRAGWVAGVLTPVRPIRIWWSGPTREKGVVFEPFFPHDMSRRFPSPSTPAYLFIGNGFKGFLALLSFCGVAPPISPHLAPPGQLHPSSDTPPYPTLGFLFTARALAPAGDILVRGSASGSD